VKAGSEFERFYEREAQSVFGAVFLLCRDATLAEDATQEAFARALARWDRLGTQPWAGGWVMTTALNAARRGLRRRHLPLEASPNPGHSPDVELWAAVRRLPRRQQQTVVLRYRMDLPVREIAEILGCREGTVRTHLARARESLRSSLGDEPDGD
jgi:DNA-directed RNA polymerase specialized sigma24 family protein